MTDYDPDIIQSFAERLYSQARWLVVRYSVICSAVGLLMGLIARSAVSVVAGKRDGFELEAMACGLGVLGGFLGWMAGNERAFSLRLQAQTALCQVKIEENTRHATT